MLSNLKCYANVIYFSLQIAHFVTVIYNSKLPLQIIHVLFFALIGHPIRFQHQITFKTIKQQVF